jgi:hypothetical protein
VKPHSEQANHLLYRQGEQPALSLYHPGKHGEAATGTNSLKQQNEIYESFGNTVSYQRKDIEL